VDINSNEIWLVVMSALANAGIVFGVVRTELKFLRRDVDYANQRINDHFLDYPHLPERREKRRAHGSESDNNFFREDQ
jgi:hypothetical protein